MVSAILDSSDRTYVYYHCVFAFIIMMVSASVTHGSTNYWAVAGINFNVEFLYTLLRTD